MVVILMYVRTMVHTLSMTSRLPAKYRVLNTDCVPPAQEKQAIVLTQQFLLTGKLAMDLIYIIIILFM